MTLTIDDLDDMQRVAVEKCIDTAIRCVAVSGEAGSGKTTIMRFAYQALKDAGYTVALVAPTGKAAKRIREATGLPSMTIHKLLEYGSPMDIDPRTGKPFGITFPKKNKFNCLGYDVIMADEYAMVPRELHASLTHALPASGRLLVFGDDQQLPPIEANPKDRENYPDGRPKTAFTMLLDKFGVRLATVHRQAEGSDILVNAQRIRSGMIPQNKEVFTLLARQDIVAEVLKQLGVHDYAALDNQIITPANISYVGTHKMNMAIQAFLWADKGLPKFKPMRWKNKATGKGSPEIVLGVGDKVLVTRNDYMVPCDDGSEGMYNGEVGTVIEVSEVDEVVIDFGDRTARIPPAMQGSYDGKVFVNYPQRDIDLAYAITTHKAQGSEYKHVCYIASRSTYRMLSRRNLYTAVTRARESVTIVHDTDALVRSVTLKEQANF